MAEESSVNPIVKFGVLAIVVAVVAGAVVPLAQQLGNEAGGGANVVSQKLSRVPVFTVTDSTGRPYLTESNDGRQRKGFFFVKASDAEEYLTKVREDSGDAKVLAISLDEAIKFLNGKAGPSKTVPERFELFPDEHELSLAQTLTNGEFQRSFGERAVPIFYLDGLALKGEDEAVPVYPLFFEKEDLDKTVQGLKEKDPDANLDKMDLQIIELLETVRQIQVGGNDRLNRVVFVPSNEALNALTVLNAKKAE